MGTLGILAFAAAIQIFPAEGPHIDEEEPPPPADEASVEDAPSLELQGVDARDRRGETIGVETPVGRMEVMLLWADAQRELGLLEEPLDEAVLAFAPAGVFCRKERPTGRVVLSLPVLRF